jgi:two-component sensor histidine kinase
LYRFVFLIHALLFSATTLANTLPQKIEQLAELFDYTSAVAFYDIQVIQADYPNQLISPHSMLPQTADYPLKDIQILYRLANTCTGPLPLSPLTTEPLVFTRAICKGTVLPNKWFARSGLIHPGGGSYAARYALQHPDRASQLQQYMHINERPLAENSSLLGRLQLMNSDGILALVSGSRMILQGAEVWVRKGERYFVFPESVLDSHSNTAELIYSPIFNTPSCFFKRGNICFTEPDETDLLKKLLLALVISNLLLLGVWGVYRWNSKRKELQSRMLVLQILTHELRTPIASLGMTVEGFRREFELLPESVYDEFRRLCEDSRRLRQLAEASKDYLQSDNQILATQWIPSIKEWLEYRLEEYGEKITLTVDKDAQAKVNIYWLGNCLDNLVKNAIKYGVSPIEVRVNVYAKSVRISVIDQGKLNKRDWNKIKKPFVSESGLGLGLTIVDSMIGRMGGNLKLVGPPTEFKMEIPCDTNIASS